MKKILFFGLPGALGHINPSLSFVEKLVARGCHLVYYADAQSKSNIEKTGAEFRDFALLHSFRHEKNVATDWLSLARKQIEITESIFPELLDMAIAEKPDVILYDSCAAWGKRLALKLGVKHACFMTTVVSDIRTVLSDHRFFLEIAPYFFRFSEMLAYLSKVKSFDRLHGLPSSNFLQIGRDALRNEGELNIMSMMPFMQPFAASLPKSYHFIGYHPYAKREMDARVDIPDSPFIYASMGTIHNDNVLFYQRLMKALSITRARAIVVLGDKVKIGDIGSLPDGVMAVPFASQLAALAKARLFISHGGMNSIHESLLAGVPMIFAPQTPEQLLNARQIEKLGAGKIIKRKMPSVDDLVLAIEHAFNNDSMSMAAATAQKSIADYKGMERVVELL
jgi:MGT family glycosyltransferase